MDSLYPIWVAVIEFAHATASAAVANFATGVLWLAIGSCVALAIANRVLGSFFPNLWRKKQVHHHTNGGHHGSHA